MIKDEESYSKDCDSKQSDSKDSNAEGIDAINAVDNSALLQILDSASSKDAQEEQIKEFYLHFLTASLIVPRRFQGRPVKNVAIFPSPFTDFLALQAEDDNFIPIFSDREELTLWSEEPLDCLILTGKTICERAPEGWWISLNPSSELGKEFSPWEISRLKGGRKEELAEILSEQQEDQEIAVAFSALSEEEHERFAELLTPILQSHPTIDKIFVGRHGEQKIGEDSTERYICAVVISNEKESEKVKDILERSLNEFLIGDLELDIHIGETLDDSPALALFRFSKPVISQPAKGLKLLIERVAQWLFSKKIS